MEVSYELAFSKINVQLLICVFIIIFFSISDWNYQPLRIPPPKKSEERDINHKQMWNRYTENRSKQPPPTGPVRIAQPPPKGPVRIAQTPQGQFIHCLEQKAYSNIPMIPRTATPLPPVQTMVQPGNQISSTPCLPIVRPVQQQLRPVNQQLHPTQQQPCHRQTFLPKNLLNGLLIYLFIIIDGYELSLL